MQKLEEIIEDLGEDIKMLYRDEQWDAPSRVGAKGKRKRLESSTASSAGPMAQRTKVEAKRRLVELEL